MDKIKPQALSTYQAAEYLNVSVRQLYNLRKSGKLAFLRLGKSIRFRVAALESYLGAMEAETANESSRPQPA